MRAAQPTQILATLVLVALAGCSQQPNVVPSRNFDRPTDMVIGCVGLFAGENEQPRATGRPMSECHPPNKVDPTLDASRRTFGFVTNTARGELSVIDLDKSRLVDLDPEVTGFNTAPLGVLPEAMAISPDGRRVLTANRGSCDLTVVDPGELMLPKLAVDEKLVDVTSNPTAAVTTMTVRSGAQRLQLAPYEVQFLPQDVRPPAAGAAETVSWRALVTFPTCDLVATVEVPSGNIIDSVFVRAAADGKSILLEPGGATPQCPFVDCGMGPRPTRPIPDAAAETATPDGGSSPDASDAGAPDGPVTTEGGVDATPDGDGGTGADGGAVMRPVVRVVDEPFIGTGPLGAGALAVHPDGTRAYVGLSNASFVAAIAIEDGKLTTPVTGTSIYLHEGALGSNRIRLSVDPNGFYGNDDPNGPLLFGRFVGERMQRDRRYLYVIARDGTVRVIHVANDARPESECDTNVDPRLLTQEMRTQTACFVVDPQRRKALAVGPGISVPGLPRDVTVADLRLDDADELAVDGAFAFVLTATGNVFIVSLDPTLRKIKGVAGTPPAVTDITEPAPVANTLRDWNVVTYSRQLSPAAGPARLDVLPVAPPSGPRLEGYLTTNTDDNATATGTPVPTFVFFPDRSTVQSQSWAITWEGPLFADQRYSAKVIGPLRTPEGKPALESVLRDRGGGFCRLGVAPGDVVVLEGCVDSSQCGVGQVCVASTAAGRTAAGLPIKGLCLDPSPVKQEQQKEMCRRLQETVRRYEIVKVHPTELVVRPKVDELVKPSLKRCVVNADCQPSNDPTHKGFTCMDGRCIKRCEKDEDCRAGRKCVQFPAAKLCADGPELVEECFPQLTSYRVHVGRSFLVRGNGAAPPNTTLSVPDPAATRFEYPNRDPLICADDPARNPVVATRIPMDSPACKNVTVSENLDGRSRPDTEPIANRQLLEIAHTAPDPNPCLFIAGPTEGDATALPPMAGGQMGEPPRHVRALFQNAELRFIFSNLEQPFAENFDLHFDVHGGFRPQSVIIPPDTIDIGMPARLLVAPMTALKDMPNGVMPYLLVVDQRRLGRTRGSTATRGQVLRIHPQGPFQRQPVYQDFSASGGLFPIQ